MPYKCKIQRAQNERKRFLEGVVNLSDTYIKRLIRISAKKFKETAILTPTAILKKRAELLEKRSLKKVIKETGNKACITCLKTKNITCFSRHGKECNKCQDKKGYISRDKNKMKKTNAIKALTNKSSLNDVYLRRLIRSNMRNYGSFKKADVPQDFIDLKRKELTLKRKIENGNKKNQNQSG